MKTKGIPIWEQYLEHIVLGVALLALVAFTAMQFIGSPNAVEVAGVGKVNPSEVDDLLEKKAQELSGRSENVDVKLPDPSPVLAKFREAKESAVSPRPELQYALAPRISPVPRDVTIVGDRLFVVPQIAAPFDVVNRQYFDTLPEETVSEFGDLRKVLAPEPPYDITWITTAAKFNAADVLRQLGSVGPNGEAPLPPRWFDNTIFFVDVRIEREELVNGGWTQSTLLEPIPGQLSFRTLIAGRVDASARDQILTEVSTPAGRDALIRPEFYAGAAAAWAPPIEKPDAIVPADAEDTTIADLKVKLARDRKEYERVNKRFTDLGCPMEEPPKKEPSKTGPQTPPRTGGGGGTSAGGDGISSGGGRQIGGSNRPQTVDNERECRGLRRKLKALNEQITRVETELAKLEAEAPKAEAPTEEPERLDQLMVWGHDINIQPGKTYRYRIVVEIFNPMFLRANELMPPQKQMAEQFALASAASEWSDPITADPPLRLFVINAKPVGTALGQLPAGTASAEVFRFRDGRWWQDKFPVQPGERIGGVKGKQAASIDYSTDWFVLDVVPDIAANEDDISRNFGAIVLLQSLSEEGMTQTRYPREDASDPELAYLRQEVAAAKSSENVASAKP